jgi:fructose-bisphosphate aldolase class I
VPDEKAKSGMSISDARTTVEKLITSGKGVLATDDTVPTVTRRLTTYGIDPTVESRLAYREMFFTTPGISEFVSGFILQDETIRQSNADGTPLIDLLLRQGIIPGIRVDAGVIGLAAANGEYVTEGLDGLGTRVEMYRHLGASFAAWRAVIKVSDTLPSAGCLRGNTHALARYAAVCQQQSVAPIVEPEVLMDGPHTIERCEEVTGAVLHALFDELHSQHVTLEAMLLKPNMVMPGVHCPDQASVQEVAEATVRCLRRHVPAAVPGIIFLSGSQNPLQATMHLSAINQIAGPTPWRLSFSYGRALQDEALEAWQRGHQDRSAGQKAFYHRARCASAAALGLYTTAMEMSRTPPAVERGAKRNL